jgi:hypothetical protein
MKGDIRQGVVRGAKLRHIKTAAVRTTQEDFARIVPAPELRRDDAAVHSFLLLFTALCVNRRHSR